MNPPDKLFVWGMMSIQLLQVASYTSALACRWLKRPRLVA